MVEKFTPRVDGDHPTEHGPMVDPLRHGRAVPMPFVRYQRTFGPFIIIVLILFSFAIGYLQLEQPLEEDRAVVTLILLRYVAQPVGMLAIVDLLLLRFVLDPGDPSRLKPDASFAQCNICQVLRPPGSHHCRECDACVVGFDHHCLALGRCIGAGNRKPFVLLLALGAFAWSLLAAAAVRVAASEGWPREAPALDPAWRWLGPLASAYGVCMIWLPATLLVQAAAALAFFAAFQMLLIARGETMRMANPCSYGRRAVAWARGRSTSALGERRCVVVARVAEEECRLLNSA